MKKLSHDPFFHHFSHPHPLALTNSESLNMTRATCSACKLQSSSGWMYTCKPCNFTLHVSCSQMPSLIMHPSHPLHPLSLLTAPAYPGGAFNCDGCGRQGHGFCYRCGTCEFDIHITCASNPLSLTHQAHPHQLQLTFHPPYQTNGFSCDICRGIGSNHWLYRCGPCEFDAHVDCATGVAPLPLIHQQQPHLQHGNSFPGTTWPHQVADTNEVHNRPGGGINGYMLHSQSMGAMPMTSYQQPSTGTIAMGTGPMTSYQQPSGAIGARYDMMNVMVQGFVQTIMSADNNGGSSDPNSPAGVGSPSPSIINVGSSILSSMFCDSDSQN